MKRIHEQYLLLEYERLKAKGFRCIPLLKPLPDLIAIKGEKLEVHAVEVVHKTDPAQVEERYEKIPWYDNVIVAIYPIEPPPSGKLRPRGTIDAKGRIVIPKHIRNGIDIKEGTFYEMETHGDKILITFFKR